MAGRSSSPSPRPAASCSRATAAPATSGWRSGSRSSVQKSGTPSPGRPRSCPGSPARIIRNNGGGASPVRARLATTFQSLTVRNYRLFITGQMLKLLGSWMQVTAQDWLVLQMTDNSAQALWMVTAFQFTPVLLLTLYGGKLADRFDKRKKIGRAHV